MMKWNGRFQIMHCKVVNDPCMALCGFEKGHSIKWKFNDTICTEHIWLDEVWINGIELQSMNKS